jgi:hypothetical protein
MKRYTASSISYNRHPQVIRMLMILKADTAANILLILHNISVRLQLSLMVLPKLIIIAGNGH